MTGRLILLAWVFVIHSAFAHAANFGALAYDHTTGAWGSSFDQPSQQFADVRAIRECEQFTTRCNVVVRFWDICAAYATGDGTSFGWGAHENRRAAEQRAVAECGTRGNNCRVRMWACNSQPPQQPSEPTPCSVDPTLNWYCNK
jgi:Domain of unknown function (DUF4189)